jgi:hypothetical protein
MVITVILVGIFGLFFVAYSAVKKKLRQIDEVHEIPYSPDNVKDIRFFVPGHYEEIEFVFGDGRIEYLRAADIFTDRQRVIQLEKRLHRLESQRLLN